MSYIDSIDRNYPIDARYEFHINQSFTGQQRDDLTWMYTQMHLIDDAIDSKGDPVLRCKNAHEIMTQTLRSDMYQSMSKLNRDRYMLNHEDLVQMTSVLKEMAYWPTDKSQFNNYHELEEFNYRLMSEVAHCVSPIIFAEKIADVRTKEYFSMCFTQHMMAMQVINLVKDVEEDSRNGQHFFPQDWLNNGVLLKDKVEQLKEYGDQYLLRGSILGNEAVSGKSGAAFVQGLTQIYTKLFTLCMQ
jgi:phytoene/squalene synthetase